MDILIHECSEQRDKKALTDIKESLPNLASEGISLSYQKTLIHNDFNPRNVMVRRGGVPCIYDWELAVVDFPQRDILEFLSFVLPEDFREEELWIHLNGHFEFLKLQIKDPAFSWNTYLAACVIALKTYICCRVSFYEVSGIVAKYDFSQRILRVSLKMLHCIVIEMSKR
jgi:hydroxymethylglutaryl-CoA reductase (NADPH)